MEKYAIDCIASRLKTKSKKTLESAIKLKFKRFWTMNRIQFFYSDRNAIVMMTADVTLPVDGKLSDFWEDVEAINEKSIWQTQFKQTPNPNFIFEAGKRIKLSGCGEC